jgi:hypothetical protein
MVVVPFFAAVTLFAQSAASPGTPASSPGTAQTPASKSSPAPCKHSAAPLIPLSSTFQASVAGTLDSAHLKVGKEIWVNVDNDIVYPGCTLNAGTALYGHVTTAAAGTDSNLSELSLTFDHADCKEQRKKEMPLRLIAILGPTEDVMRVHEELPIQMRGAKRNIKDAVNALNGSSDKFNKEGPPGLFPVGVVIGIPGLKLEIEGGPGCSSRITSTNRRVQLMRGVQLIFVVESP